ncbi:MAG: hypothetical protein J6B77_04220, partial [Clostridia bacterium]|nr:hypothetical protein [Clostridia bacterium]
MGKSPQKRTPKRKNRLQTRRFQEKFHNQCSQKCTSFRPKVHTERASFFVVLKATGNHKSGAPEWVVLLS